MKKYTKTAKEFAAIFLLLCGLFFSKTLGFSQRNQKMDICWHGMASYYHPKFNGRKTSTGEIFSNTKLTCANNFLNLGTLIRVTNLSNGKTVIVKVNDRMHPNNHRFIDLSQAAARQLGIIQQGIGEVSIEILETPETQELALK